MNGERKIMIGILAQQIQDYVSAKEMTNFSFKKEIKKIDDELEKQVCFDADRSVLDILRRKRRMATRGVEAECYIFDNNKESENYVFGFIFICRTIGLDPERFRRKIRELKLEKIREFKTAYKTKQS